MARWLKVLGVLAAFAAGPSLAHERGDQAMGVVESVTPERIVITTRDGHAVSFAVNAETRFYVGEQAARAKDVRAGERAVVHGRRSGDTLTAVRVKVAPRPQK